MESPFVLQQYWPEWNSSAEWIVTFLAKPSVRISNPVCERSLDPSLYHCTWADGSESSQFKIIGWPLWIVLFLSASGSAENLTGGAKNIGNDFIGV